MQEQQEHYQKLYESTLRRLRLLEQQAAVSGYNTTPQISIEIGDLHTQLEYLETLVTVGDASELLESAGEVGRWQIRSREMRRLQKYVGQESAVTRSELVKVHNDARILILLLVLWLAILTILVLYH